MALRTSHPSTPPSCSHHHTGLLFRQVFRAAAAAAAERGGRGLVAWQPWLEEGEEGPLAVGRGGLELSPFFSRRHRHNQPIPPPPLSSLFSNGDSSGKNRSDVKKKKDCTENFCSHLIAPSRFNCFHFSIFLISQDFFSFRPWFVVVTSISCSVLLTGEFFLLLFRELTTTRFRVVVRMCTG